MPDEDEIDLVSVERFIRLAVQAGAINTGTAYRLHELAENLGGPPSPPAAAPPSPAAAAARATLRAAAALLSDPAARLSQGERSGLRDSMVPLRQALETGDESRLQSAAARVAALLAAARRSAATPPPARPARPVPPPVAHPAPARPAAPHPPAPPAPPAGPTGAERARRRLGELRSRLSGDFAIHGITYLGVLLALVVLVVFFTVDNYFGRTFGIPWTRPFIFMVFPTFFFVLSWVLRHRSGIPQAAIAIELIGAVLVPAMVAALFRDGYHIPPNAEQLWRWPAYAGSGLVTLVLFGWLAHRRRLYAYLVGPTIWTIAGALGLFLHFHWVDLPAPARDMPEGVSAYQVVAILGAMALTVLAATLLRHTPLGRLVSIPTVRGAVVLGPLVLLAAIQFAYSDALLEGPPGVGPGLEQMGRPLALAAAAAGALYLAARGAAYAWVGWGARAERDLPGVVAVLGNIALVAAPALGLAEVVPLPWLGVILGAAGIGLAALERIPGIGRRSGSWVAGAAAVGGLALALGSGGATLAAWGLAAGALAVFPAGVAALFRVAALPAGASRAALWVASLVALGAGAGRLAWPEGTAWVLVGSAASLAGMRWGKGLPADVRSLSGAPAAVLVAGSLGVVAARAAAGSGPGLAVTGATVLAAGLALFLVDLPWPARLLPGTALLAAGGLLEVRSVLAAGTWSGAAADAGVLGGLGLALTGDALLRRSGRHRVWHGAVGHLLLLAALGRSLPHERSAIVGLSLLLVGLVAEAAAVEGDRSPLIARLAALPGAGPGWRALPAAGAAAVLPFLAVLAGRQIPGVAAEAPRRGLILAATALGMAAAVAGWRRRARLRTVGSVAGTLVALAGVALAVPSPTALVLATGTAAAATAAIAASCRLPWVGALPAAGLAATFLLALWRGGIAPLDLRFGMLGAGAVLAGLPAAIHWGRGRPVPVRGPWLAAPLVEGLALVAGAVGLGLARPRLLGLIALVAAALFAFVGWSGRVGAFAVPAAAAVAIAYAHLLQGPWPPFADGLRFMPLAAALVGAAALLPGHRSWRVLADPSPGTLLVGLAVAGMGVGVGAHLGEAAPALLCLAGLLAAVGATRRSEGWLYAGLITAFVGGLTGAPEWTWLAATAAGEALVVGVLAVRRAAEPAGQWLAWIAAGLAAVAFGAMTGWGAWSTVPLLTAAAAAAAVSLPAATVLGMGRSWRPGAAVWQLPVAALAAGSGATLLSQGHMHLALDALGIDAGTLAAFALAAGLVGTRRLWPGMAAASSALAAAAYGCLAGWLEWDAGMLVGVTAAVGAGLAGGALVLSLRDAWPARWLLWRPWLHLLAQGAAAVAAVTAVDHFAAPRGLGVVSGVLAGEAALAGALGTVRLWPGLAGVAAGFAAGAYACLAGWQGWSAAFLLAVTAAVGALLAGSALAASYWRGAPARLAVWRAPLHALAQGAVVVVAGSGVAAYGVPEGLGVVAAVLAVEAVLAGAVGTVEQWPGLAALAAAFAAGAYGCLAGWLVWGTDTLVGVTAAAGVTLAAGATAVGRWGGAPARLALWRVPLHGLAQGAAAAVVVAALGGYGPAGALAAAAAGCAFEAILLGLNARLIKAEYSPRWLSAELAAAALFLALAAVGRAGWPAGPWVQGAAGLALVSAIGYGLARAGHPWRSPLGAFTALVAPGAVIAAAWMLGSPYAHTAAALAFGGADLMAIGLLTRRLAFVEGGLVTWLGAGLLTFGQHLDFTSHQTVVPVVVALLIVLEVERSRRRHEGGEPSPHPLRLLEWALMLAPLALSVADAASELWYLGVLAGEAVALTAWGIITEVRRRALLGVGALAAAVVLAAIIPLSRGVSAGLAGGTWLAIGAGAAVLLIAVGSTLERQRRRLGRALAAAGRAMEGWE